MQNRNSAAAEMRVTIRVEIPAEMFTTRNTPEIPNNSDQIDYGTTPSASHPSLVEPAQNLF
jgi:hypothetical protein